MLWCLAPDLSGRRQTPSRRSAAEQYQRLATQLEPAAGPISFSIALVKGHLENIVDSSHGVRRTTTKNVARGPFCSGPPFCEAIGKEGFLLGGRTRARTWDPLIKSCNFAIRYDFRAHAALRRFPRSRLFVGLSRIVSQSRKPKPPNTSVRLHRLNRRFSSVGLQHDRCSDTPERQDDRTIAYS